MKILNLTQHKATPEQKKSGVIDYENARDEFLLRKEKDNDDVALWKLELPENLVELLTFEQLPSRGEINNRVLLMQWIARQLGYKKAMIGGAPYMMAALESALKAAGVQPVYAFSKEEIVDEKMTDGSIKKRKELRHFGFVDA